MATPHLTLGRAVAARLSSAAVLTGALWIWTYFSTPARAISVLLSALR